jgi:hypothetical protein
MVEPLFPFSRGRRQRANSCYQFSFGNTPAAELTPGDFPAQRTEALDAFADALRG